jgi:Ca2+-binding RTX toxin-like protein
VSLLSGTGSGGYAQGDTLTNIEHLTGSWYDDFLIGNDGDNVLAGLGGDDILKGGGGADTLFGGSGNERHGRQRQLRVLRR